ncbi:MAG TPA: exo-alpha-sialidase, partial [Pseudonocardiaceae bacterium]
LGGPGTNYPNAEVEPYVAVNPANATNVIGAWQQDRWRDGGAHGLVAGASFNGGLTWTETTLPFDACAPGGAPYTRASDPWVSIGPDGTAYSNAIAFDETDANNAVLAATSTDGGKTWGNLNAVVSYTGTTQFFTDKNSITADPVRAGVAYSVWDTLISPNANPDADLHAFAYTGPGYFSATADGGRTWSTPKVIFPTAERKQTIGNELLVDPRSGALYDFANWIIQPNTPNGERDQLAFVKSTDGGATWSAPKAVTNLDDIPVTDPNTGALIRTGDIIPEVAIDGRTGALYAVWQDADFSGGAFDEVAFASSTDGGATWTAPKRISTPTGRPAFTPQIAVTSSGTVGVTYYDFRNLTAGNTTTLPTDYWFTSSGNGGQTWSASAHVAGPFDMLFAPYARGFFVGDYEGLAAKGGSFQSLFVQTNCPGACDPNNRTDIYTATVTP